MLMNENYIKRKTQIVLKDLDQSFSSYSRHSSQITTLRGWSITLVVAYIGLIVTKSKINFSFISFLPILFIIVGFLALEIIERASMLFNANNAKEIQDLFSYENEDQFIEKIISYITMDQKLSTMSFQVKLKWLFSAIFGRKHIVWYSFLILAVFFILLVLRGTT
jgi:hypothetical protein